jgi:hydrogenase nickel incorporation protein HypA/HybF
MHEISLVRNMFLTIEEQFPDVSPARVRCIYLTLGELSNVEPIAMQSAFEAVILDDTRYGHVRLEITVTPILIYCSDCQKTVGVKDYRFVCDCGKPSREVVQGDEVVISGVELAD